jgi:hypothetical protein
MSSKQQATSFMVKYQKRTYVTLNLLASKQETSVLKEGQKTHFALP